MKRHLPAAIGPNISAADQGLERFAIRARGMCFIAQEGDAVGKFDEAFLPDVEIVPARAVLDRRGNLLLAHQPGHFREYDNTVIGKMLTVEIGVAGPEI